jgi:hypothetical protein
MNEEELWRKEAKIKLERMPPKAKEIRERALNELHFFARLVNPTYQYGSVHEEVFAWLQEYNLFGQGANLTSNKLIMLPRAHLKSHMVATWCAWIITRHPEVTMLYTSATSELAQTQLYAIQNILGSSVYQKFFPEYINPQEGKREKWSSMKLSVDHIKRKEEGVRDPTITTAGLTTNTTGWHADIILADDIVVPENAYTEDGREAVSKKASQFTSIRNSGGFTLACGTRYHPSDIYKVWKGQEYEDYDDNGDFLGKTPVWSIKEYVVEEDGIYTWPRTVREDGKAFGFDARTLSRIRAEYSDVTQFFAQYYNNPNEASSNRLSRDSFQYYNPRFLTQKGGTWYFNDNRLNVYAAVDFAFSLKKEADFTAIVVIGVDCDRNVYVLDIDRFKSDRVSGYFKHIKDLHSKWGFRKLRAEVTVAQQVIVNELKALVKREGLSLPIEDYRPSAKEGTKAERIKATLEHRYDEGEIWHREGGWTNILEDELIQAKPAHDDIKDSLASAVEISVPPKKSARNSIKDFFSDGGQFNNRFGGVSFR